MIGLVFWTHMVYAMYCQSPLPPCDRGWHCYVFVIQPNNIRHLCQARWYKELSDGWVQMDGGPISQFLPAVPNRKPKP